LLAPFRGSLAPVQAAKEFRRIAQFLGLDAKLVTAACIELGKFFATLRQRRASCPAAKSPIGRSSCGVVHCPACSHAPTSSVSTRKRAESTASRARLSAASRRCAISCESDGMPRQCPPRFRIGATTRFMRTSSSRAGPSSPASHLSSALMAAVCGPCRRTRNNDTAARSRRNPTRIWCTPSGSPFISAGSLSMICLRQATPITS